MLPLQNAMGFTVLWRAKQNMRISYHQELPLQSLWLCWSIGGDGTSSMHTFPSTWQSSTPENRLQPTHSSTVKSACCLKFFAHFRTGMHLHIDAAQKQHQKKNGEIRCVRFPSLPCRHGVVQACVFFPNGVMVTPLTSKVWSTQSKKTLWKFCSSRVWQCYLFLAEIH